MLKPKVMTWTVVGCLAVFGAAGCTTEQTQPGEAPDIDVDVDPGQWPEYKVNWADVDVGTREQTVTVPVVRIEQETRQVTVPYIDINPPGAGNREERTIQVPHTVARCVPVTTTRYVPRTVVMRVHEQRSQTGGRGTRGVRSRHNFRARPDARFGRSARANCRDPSRLPCTTPVRPCQASCGRASDTTGT